MKLLSSNMIDEVYYLNLDAMQWQRKKLGKRDCYLGTKNYDTYCSTGCSTTDCTIQK